MWNKAFLKLNKNCRLKNIDLEIVDTARQRSNGKSSLGIYEVDADTLTLIASEPGEHRDRYHLMSPVNQANFILRKKIIGFAEIHFDKVK